MASMLLLKLTAIWVLLHIVQQWLENNRLALNGIARIVVQQACEQDHVDAHLATSSPVAELTKQRWLNMQYTSFLALAVIGTLLMRSSTAHQNWLY